MINKILEDCPHVKILVTSRTALARPGIREKLIEIKGLTEVTIKDKKVPSEDEKACWELFAAYHPDLGRNEMTELRKFKVDKKYYSDR